MPISVFNKLRRFYLCGLLLFSLSSIAQQPKTEEDIKKEASKLFEDDDFTGAYKYYTQLVSNYPKDPEFNYRLGVCMLYSEPDKKKCYSYLKFASNYPKDAPKDAKFYLAKAYHMNYQFDEAIKFYNEYKNIGSSSQIKKLQVDREIEACRNGKRLLSSLQELVVINKKQLNEADYFRSYDLSGVGGKLLVKPDDFKTSYDKKKKDKSVVYLPKMGDRVFFSSYGENGNTGRDIYFAIRMADGRFAKAQKVVGINTDFDEDYPFLHPNGRTLYFSSKGYNSMGGYDIFKSTYNEALNTWSAPVNLEFPINSPDDDYLFVTDTSEKVAFFSTGRQSPPGKIDVLKINTERRPMEFAFLKGTVLKDEAEQSLESKITVKNIDNGQVIGTFEAADNGDYHMDLPNGGKFIFTVQTPGLPTQSDKVIMPTATTLRPFKQTISYENKVLKITNYFEVPPDDNNYLAYLEVIEKKAKLDVNADDFKNSTLNNGANSTPKDTTPVNTNSTIASNQNTVNSTSSGSNTTTATNTASTSAKQGLTNQQLLDVAKKDATEAKSEAQKLIQDANEASEIANQKKIETESKLKEADEIIKNATTITDEGEKQKAYEKANEIKQEAKTANEIAIAINNYAIALNEDAKNKEKEALLNSQLSTELQNVIKDPKNKAAQTKADNLQKQIDELSKQNKQSDEQLVKIKTSNEQKQNEIAKATNTTEQLKKESDEIKTTIANNEAELTKTKDKQLKENLKLQIEDEKKDLESKNKEIDQNEQKVAVLKKEAVALQTQTELTEKIKGTSTGSSVAINSNATNTNTAGNSNSIPSNTATGTNTVNNTGVANIESISTKYTEKLNAVPDKNSKAGLEESNTILGDYNKQLNDMIALDKLDFNSNKTPEEKKKLNAEIKKFEDQKAINEKQIAANNSQIKQIENNSVVATNTNTNSTSTNTNSAVTSNTSAIVSNSVTGNENNSGNANSTVTNTPTTSSNSVIASNSGNSTPPVKVNFNGTDDISKLDELKNYLNNSENTSFAYKDYKDVGSQNLKKDAENKLVAVNTTKNELANLIAAAEKDLKNPTSTENIKTTESVTKEGDDLKLKAKEKRTESQTKEGAEKEKLLNEAVDLTKEANQKYLEASEIEKTKDKNEFLVNNENITGLLNTKKSTQADITEAQKLNEEAQVAFKQAQAIRDEANALTNTAAKLGTINNAEEKEHEALIKQKQAVDLLMKANKTFALKSPEAGNTGTSAAQASLNKVKEQYAKLNDEKISAYMALSKANQNQSKLQLAQLNKNPAIKNNSNTEAVLLKKQSEDLNKEALSLISKSLTEPDAADKQFLLQQANQKEIESLSALNKANEALKNTAVATNTTTGNENNVAVNTNTTTGDGNNTAVKTKTTTAGNGNNVAVKTKTTTTGNNVAVKTKTTTTGNGNNVAVKTKTTTTGNENNVVVKTKTTTVDENNAAKESAKKFATINDTTIKDALIYLDKNINLKNTEANTLKNTSLASLKNLADEQTKLDEEIKNSSNTSKRSEEEIKNEMNQLNASADSICKQASELRKEAASKEGEEKDKLITEAKALEAKCANNRITASDLQKNINDAQFTSNNDAITNYLEKAKGKTDPEIAQAQELITQVNILKRQAKAIREEANNQTSSAAKLGGYSNAEEKEAELLMKQLEAINLLKKYDEAYEPKANMVSSGNAGDLKEKHNAIDQKEIDQLTNINKAFIMEYETSSAKVPANLTAQQKTAKAKADNLITESKDLIAKANQSVDLKLKKELLAKASKSGQDAILSLNKVPTTGGAVATNRNNTTNPTNNTTSNNTINTNTNTNANNTTANNTTNTNTNTTANNTTNTNRNNTNRNTTNTNATANTNRNTNRTNTAAVTLIKVEGLEVKNNNAYTADKPIPVDEKIPDGLVFRVQIGAFKAALPNSTFKGLSPVNAQTTSNGYIRYTAGNFNKFEIANAVKNDLRNLGYKDAFVVGFYDGKRITVAEAVDILEKQGKSIDLTNNTSAGIKESSNVPRNTAVTTNNTTNVPADAVVVTKELEKINGLLYTVQIGVYSKQVSRSLLYSLTPIYTEKLPTGLFRYTAGIYNQPARLLDDRTRVVSMGIKDAFISAYYNGKRVPYADGKKLQQDSVNLKMEPENPIVFPEGNVNPPPPENTSANTPTVAPFSNGVANAPEATPENGIKTDENGISFKVQIGAFRNQVPNEVAAKFSNIKTWPVANKIINGLYLYTIGNFVDAKSAKALKDEAIALGIGDAFITVYKDGKKLYGAEAADNLNK